MLALLAAASVAFLLPGVAPLSSSRRLAPPVCREAEYIFELDETSIKFGCQQRTITMVKPEEAGTLYDFVTSDPAAIVSSSWGPGAVRPSETTPGEFIIQLEDFDFVALRIQVELTMAVSLDEETGTATLESKGFRLIGPGLAGIGEMIDVRVAGAMRPSPPSSSLCSLTGDVRFLAAGELPGVLRGVPEPALRAAARAVSSNLIVAASKLFSTNVPNAYAEWAREKASGAALGR